MRRCANAAGDDSADTANGQFANASGWTSFNVAMGNGAVAGGASGNVAIRNLAMTVSRPRRR
jgi:hypothetical protein